MTPTDWKNFRGFERERAYLGSQLSEEGVNAFQRALHRFRELALDLDAPNTPEEHAFIRGILDPTSSTDLAAKCYRDLHAADSGRYPIRISARIEKSPNKTEKAGMRAKGEHGSEGVGKPRKGLGSERRKYLELIRRGFIGKVSLSFMTASDKQRMNRYGSLLQALAEGSIAPRTDLQARFVQLVQVWEHEGEHPPEGERWANMWVDYLMRVRFEEDKTPRSRSPKPFAQEWSHKSYDGR
jgi:uncharacterized protein YifE (UPF0438 family)